jgi:hypothetical protein
MPQTKREKKASKDERDRLRRQACRDKEKHSRRKLRVAQNADDAHEADHNVGLLRSSVPAWAPGAGSIVELIPGSVRMVIGVAAEEVPAMLAYLAKPLMHKAGATLAARGSVAGGERRGASVIVTTARSSSDPHMDGEDTLLFNVSGSRWAWFAPPNAARQDVPRSSSNGGPTFLPTTCDPSIHSRAECAANGVGWSLPVQLDAGDAIYIRRGWWHCLLSEAGGVAIAIEIVSTEVAGKGTCVYRHVGTRKPVSGRHCERTVARRAEWGSAASVLQLWTPALKVFKFQEDNAEEISKLKGIGKNNLFKPKPDKCQSRCKRFRLKGIPCKKVNCCSMWPCHEWEELLKSDLAITVYVDMPDYIRSGRQPGLHSSCGSSDELGRGCGPPQLLIDSCD